jgi:hypothetical protein
MASMAQVVSLIVCFGEHLSSAGTCNEDAVKLVKEKREEKRKQQEAREERARQRHVKKAQRSAQLRLGELPGAEDMEDSDAEVEEEDGAAARLLSCVSLSKLVVDFVAERKDEAGISSTLAKALNSLITGKTENEATDAWGATQVRLLLLALWW